MAQVRQGEWAAQEDPLTPVLELAPPHIRLCLRKLLEAMAAGVETVGTAPLTPASEPTAATATAAGRGVTAPRTSAGSQSDMMMEAVSRSRRLDLVEPGDLVEQREMAASEPTVLAACRVTLALQGQVALGLRIFSITTSFFMVDLCTF
jgi:hypothetical protein